MRVAFDDQIFSHQVHGGISNYFASIARQFQQVPALGVQLEGFPIFTNNSYLKRAGMSLSLPVQALGIPPILSLANSVLSSVRRYQGFPVPDIVHHTYYYEKPWRTHSSSRHVITIHDMIPELFPDHFPFGNPHARKREHILAADAILCVSESTRQDLLALYPELSVPVLVTPLGVSGEFNPGKEGPTEHGGYFLFVGNRGGYKNFDLLMDAYAEISHQSSADLVLVGGGAIRPLETKRFRQLGVEDRIRQVTPSNRELVKLYRNAICLVFPSKYEGFGLPTVEAMASGCPTLLADTPALIEVGGGAGEYFPADDPAVLALKMTRMELDSAFRMRTRSHGLQRSSLFDWSKTALRTRDSYTAVLNS
jgi:glycosyltransferase involved in cell wall biosynthesis